MFDCSILLDKMIIKLHKGVDLGQVRTDIEYTMQEEKMEIAIIKDSEERYIKTIQVDIIETTFDTMQALMMDSPETSAGKLGKKSSQAKKEKIQD